MLTTPDELARKAAKAAYDREYRARNKERIAESKRRYGAANRERENARSQAWVEANRERSREIKQAWRDANPQKERAYHESVREKKAAYQRVYRVERAEIDRRAKQLRRRGVSHATPAWADKQAIKAIYSQARAQGLHVDHIVPLKGKTVCGLHVEYNLRLLTPAENRKKGNRHAD